MKVLSFYAVKGGVGKTTSAVNVAYHLSSSGKNILLIDLDSQGASSFYMRTRASRKLSGKTLLNKKSSLFAFIKASDYPGLDVLPAKGSFRNLDINLEQQNHTRERLRTILKEFKDEYDYIILDCPPTMTLLAENVFFASDYVFIPVIPTPLSVRTLEQVLRFFNKHDLNQNKIYIFFALVDYIKTVHQTTMSLMRTKYRNILVNAIPRTAVIEKMGIRQEPVECFARNSKGGKAYAELSDEIYEIISSDDPVGKGAST